MGNYSVLIALSVLAVFALGGYLIWKLIFRETGRLDRVISGGIWRQLGLLGAVVVYMLAACFCAFWAAEFDYINAELSFWDQMGAVFHRFFGYNYYKEDGTGLNWLLLAISIIGTLVMTGMLVSTFSNIMQQRKTDVERGNVRYRNLKGHYVLLGNGRLAPALVWEIFRHHLQEQGITDPAKATQADFRKMPQILLVTDHDADAALSGIHAFLPDELDKKVFVYLGDRLLPEVLENLALEAAKAVFVLGEAGEPGRDAVNLECARRITRVLPERGTVLPVHVQLDRPTSYSMVKKLSIPTDYYQRDGRTRIYLRPFNFYENCARSLWGCLGDAGRVPWTVPTEDSSQHHHLVIAGFGKMGQALLLEAIRLCHFPNVDEKTGRNRTQITVVDAAMDKLLPLFRSQYPELDLLTDITIDYRPVPVEDAGLREDLKTWAEDPDTLLTVALCFPDPDQTFSAALNLPDALFVSVSPQGIVARDNVRILVRQQLPFGLQDLLQGNRQKYQGISAFGLLSDGVSSRLFNDEMAMWAGAYYDFRWPDEELYPEKARVVAKLVAQFPELHTTSILDFAKDHYEIAFDAVKELWYLTNEDLRFANRYQVDMYGIYAACEGKVTPERLWRMEHLRWCADRLITGYAPLVMTPEEKVAFKPSTKIAKAHYKLHPLLVPFDDLPPSEKNKDETVIDNRKKITQLVTRE